MASWIQQQAYKGMASSSSTFQQALGAARQRLPSSADMPSFRTLGKHVAVGLGVGSGGLFKGGVADIQAAPSCSNPQLSCHNSSAVADTCCFVAPGGHILQTQFWDTHPPTGPSDSWTIHGLWPDLCSGGYDANCDTSRAYTNITDILQSFGATDLLSYMDVYWKDYQGDDETFWEHEWGKHGTCISTLDPECYPDYQPRQDIVGFFTATTALYKTLDTYTTLANAGILPSASQRYALSDIQNAIEGSFGFPVTLGCKSGALNEIWYHFNVQGSVQGGQFVATNPDSKGGKCPSTVKYLPKSGAAPHPPSSK